MVVGLKLGIASPDSNIVVQIVNVITRSTFEFQTEHCTLAATDELV